MGNLQHKNQRKMPFIVKTCMICAYVHVARNKGVRKCLKELGKEGVSLQRRNSTLKIAQLSEAITLVKTIVRKEREFREKGSKFIHLYLLAYIYRCPIYRSSL